MPNLSTSPQHLKYMVIVHRSTWIPPDGNMERTAWPQTRAPEASN